MDRLIVKATLQTLDLDRGKASAAEVENLVALTKTADKENLLPQTTADSLNQRLEEINKNVSKAQSLVDSSTQQLADKFFLASGSTLGPQSLVDLNERILKLEAALSHLASNGLPAMTAKSTRMPSASTSQPTSKPTPTLPADDGDGWGDDLPMPPPSVPDTAGNDDGWGDDEPASAAMPSAQTDGGSWDDPPEPPRASTSKFVLPPPPPARAPSTRAPSVPQDDFDMGDGWGDEAPMQAVPDAPQVQLSPQRAQSTAPSPQRPPINTTLSQSGRRTGSPAPQSAASPPPQSAASVSGRTVSSSSRPQIDQNAPWAKDLESVVTFAKQDVRSQLVELDKVTNKRLLTRKAKEQRLLSDVDKLQAALTAVIEQTGVEVRLDANLGVDENGRRKRKRTESGDGEDGRAGSVSSIDAVWQADVDKSIKILQEGMSRQLQTVNAMEQTINTLEQDVNGCKVSFEPLQSATQANLDDVSETALSERLVLMVSDPCTAERTAIEVWPTQNRAYTD